MQDLDGFILSREYRETAAGIELIFWLTTDEGPLRVVVDGQESLFFLPQSEAEACRRLLPRGRWRERLLSLRNFGDEQVAAFYFASHRTMLDTRAVLEREGNHPLEADIKPPDRFLMERFIQGSLRLRGDVRWRETFGEAVNPRVKSATYKPRFRIVSLDIETATAKPRVYSIAVYAEDASRIFMVGEGAPGVDSLEYHPSEKSAIEAFLSWIAAYDPDLVIGWNVVQFDLDYLQARCSALDIPFALGRAGGEVVWRRAARNSERMFAVVPGRVVLDGIELLRTATYAFESFSLESVARELLGRGKLIDDPDERGEEIEQLYATDKPQLAAYNLEDCRLVWDIFEQTSLVDFAYRRSCLTGLEMDRYGGSVAAFDFLYIPRLHREGYVSPPLPRSDAVEASPGGYVLDSIPGIYDHVLVLDFKSLYPSIIRTFLVDPLGLVGGGDDAVPGYRGASFARERNILPAVIEQLWAARDEAKREGDAALSQAIKIIMNSFYGVLGTPGCRFFDSRLVSSITLRGHDIILTTKRLIEEQGYRVIYGDTDSVFVHLGARERSDDEVDRIGNELVLTLNDWWSGELRAEYGLECYLELEYETHFRKFLMPTTRGSETGSKKRYAGMVAGGGELVFKGLESVRSDWSPLARNFQRELYRRIFLAEPYEDFIRETVDQVGRGLRDDELMLRKRLRRKLEDYTRNVPPHVQAARKAEDARAARGAASRYGHGGWIEYCMTVNGPEPREHLTSAPDYQFYVDRQLAPIADAILNFTSTSFQQLVDKQLGLF